MVSPSTRTKRSFSSVPEAASRMSACSKRIMARVV
jgi:hypothetical protein